MIIMNIYVLIDIQNGFAKDGLTVGQGGSLYVPGGENVAAPVARLIQNASDSFFILSQDYHPADHISFAANHTGVAPFSTILLGKNKNGIYEIAAGKTDGVIEQTAWPVHCVQGTESAMFTPEIMDILPPDMRRRMQGYVADKYLESADDRGNGFYIIRKGMRRDLDSYGIATENDGVSTTVAPPIFTSISARMRALNVDESNIYIGGLATNFCVEFSHNDIYKFLVPKLKRAGIKTQVYFLSDISAGIPGDTPDGAWPGLSAAPERMASFGTLACTADDVLRGLTASNSARPHVFPTLAR